MSGGCEFLAWRPGDAISFAARSTFLSSSSYTPAQVLSSSLKLLIEFFFCSSHTGPSYPIHIAVVILWNKKPTSPSLSTVSLVLLFLRSQLARNYIRRLRPPYEHDLTQRITMALNMALRRPLTLSRAMPRSSLLSQRSLSSLSTLRQAPRLRTARPSSISNPQLQLLFRRAYADAPTVKLSPTPKPKKRFRFFRFLWRATYLSVLGGLAYLTYTIYDAKHPPDQIDPDPSKKTLVILGRSMTRFRTRLSAPQKHTD